MKIEANGIRLAYDDRGQGLPLLFIHGYPLNRKLWAGQVEALSDQARVLALDLRGHGESQAAPGPYWMDLLADDCAAFLEAAGITRPVVVCGLSMGGYVAMAFYRQYAPQVAGLILTATRAGADSDEGKANRDKAIQLARAEGSRAVAESMLPKMFSPQTYKRNPGLVDHLRELMASLPVEAIAGDLAGMRERPDSSQTLAEAVVPALILHGADDQLIPVKEAEAMQALLRGAQLEVIPAAGHLPNLEQPERFNAALRRFLGTVGNKTAGGPG